MDANDAQAKPAFLDPKPGDLEAYPGVTESPTFDYELEPQVPSLPENTAELPPLGQLTQVPPAGKGPSRGYEVRRRMIAQLHARGFTNNQIGRHLGYSPAGISLALKDPWVQAEAARERENLIDEDAPAVLKAASLHAAKRIEQVILDPKSKNGDQMAQFVIEKNYGKAKQEVTHESGTLAAFMDLMKNMQARGEAIDVTPMAITGAQVPTEHTSDNAQQKSDIDAWLDNNL